MNVPDENKTDIRRLKELGYLADGEVSQESIYKAKMAEAETKFAEMQAIIDKQAAQIERLKSKQQ